MLEYIRLAKQTMAHTLEMQTGISRPDPLMGAVAERLRGGDVVGGVVFCDIAINKDPRALAARLWRAYLLLMLLRNNDALREVDCILSGFDKNNAFALTVGACANFYEKRFAVAADGFMRALNCGGFPSQLCELSYNLLAQSLQYSFGPRRSMDVFAGIVRAEVDGNKVAYAKRVYLELLNTLGEVSDAGRMISELGIHLDRPNISDAHFLTRHYMNTGKFAKVINLCEYFVARADANKLVEFNSILNDAARAATKTNARSDAIKIIKIIDEAFRVVGENGCSLSSEFLRRAWLSRVSCDWLTSRANLLKRLERWDAAFVCAVRAKTMRKNGLRHYDGLQWGVAHLRRCASVFNHEVMRELISRPSSVSYQPLFIIGLPRSGTSLVEQIISEGAGSIALGEVSTFTRIGHDFMSSFPSGGVKNFAASYGAEIINQWQRDGMLRNGDLSGFVVTDKMPHNFLYLGVIALAFPSAKILCCLRDLRDVLVSNLFQLFAAEFPYEGAVEDYAMHFAFFRVLMKHWASVLSGRMLNVQYEDVVASPAAELRRVFDFAGLPWDGRVLDFHKSDRVVYTASREQVKEPLNSKSVGAWRKFEKHLAGFEDMVLDYESRIARLAGVTFN